MRRAVDRAVRRIWWGDVGAVGRALAVPLLPAEFGYRCAVAARNRAFDRGLGEIESVDAAVVSVGNLIVGGAGKTPFAAWIAGELSRRGARVAILHGGYASDEPALHRRWHPEIPVHTGRDRATSARRAIEDGADVLVLDDGFQHRRLARDLDLVLVPVEGWTRRPHMLPRGPWREPPRSLARADVVVVTRKAASRSAAVRVAREAADFAPDADVAIASIRASGWRPVDGESSDARRPAGPVVAVTAIARPDLFRSNAGSEGAEIAAEMRFPDHHEYDETDASRVREVARNRPIVTTAKDALKLERLLPAAELWVLEQDVVVEEGGDRLAYRLDTLTVGAQ